MKSKSSWPKDTRSVNYSSFKKQYIEKLAYPK